MAHRRWWIGDVYLARMSAHEFRESARRAFPVRRVVFHARTCVFSVFTFYNPSTYSHVASLSPKKFQGSAHSRRRRRALGGASVQVPLARGGRGYTTERSPNRRARAPETLFGRKPEEPQNAEPAEGDGAKAEERGVLGGDARAARAARREEKREGADEVVRERYRSSLRIASALSEADFRVSKHVVTRRDTTMRLKA